MKQFAVRGVVMALVVSMAGFVEAAGTTTTVTTIKGTIAGVPGPATGTATGLATYTKTVVKNSFGVPISTSEVVSCSIKGVFLPDGGLVTFKDTTAGGKALGKGNLASGSASSVISSTSGANVPAMPAQGDQINVRYKTTLVATGVFGPPVTTMK